jgi:hypothetical protein
LRLVLLLRALWSLVFELLGLWLVCERRACSLVSRAVGRASLLLVLFGE